MPVLLSQTKREFAFMLTRKCNWSCQYCAVKNSHDQGNGELLESDVISNAKKVLPKSIVTLFGGEPGLASRNLIEKCIDILENKDCILYLETNGLFIQRYGDLLDHFHEILYHCSQELDLNDQFVQTEFQRIRYLIVVHDQNFHKLESFLDAHRKICFDIIEATYPYPDEMDGPRLSSANKTAIMTKFANRMTKESFKRLVDGKDFEPIEFL